MSLFKKEGPFILRCKNPLLMAFQNGGPIGEALIGGSCCWKVFEQSEGGTLPNLGNKGAIDDVVLLKGQFAEFTLAFKKEISTKQRLHLKGTAKLCIKALYTMSWTITNHHKEPTKSWFCMDGSCLKSEPPKTTIAYVCLSEVGLISCGLGTVNGRRTMTYTYLFLRHPFYT